MAKFILFYYRLNLANYITISQLAYDIFIKNFLKYPIEKMPNDLRYLLQKNFFANKIYTTNNQGAALFFYYVNSLYPYLMLKPLPIIFSGLYTSYNLDIFFGFIDIEIEDTVGIINFNKSNTIMFSEEVKILIKLGYRIKCNLFYRFHTSYIFDSFVEHFYTIKRYTTNHFLKYFSKISLNSLYGKLATKYSFFNNVSVSVAICSYAKI
jgi:hypothetical protein